MKIFFFFFFFISAVFARRPHPPSNPIISMGEPKDIPGFREHITDFYRGSEWREAWTFREAENEASGLYRSTAPEGIDPEKLAWGSGLKKERIASLIRNLSDWAVDDELSTKEQVLDMHQVYRTDQGQWFSQPAHSTGVRYKNLLMALNGVKGPTLQFRTESAEFTGTSGFLVTFPNPSAAPLDYEVRFTLPREIFLLDTTQAIYKVHKILDVEIETYEKQYEEKIWEHFSKRQVKSLDQSPIDPTEVEALLEYLSKEENLQ